MKIVGIKGLAVIAAIVMVGLTATGCAAQEAAAAPIPTHLPPCQGMPATPVADLNTTDKASCDITGSNVVFPDDTAITVAPGHGARTHCLDAHACPNHYAVVSIGSFGVVAARGNTSCTEVDWYGTPTGIAWVKHTLGDRWPCL